MNIDLPDLWSASLRTTVTQVEAATGVESAAWRTAGRATKAKPKGDDLTFWAEDGLRQLQAYVDWTQQTDWTLASFDGAPAIELAVSCEFGDVKVRGFIDSVWALPTGEMVVVDYKTGSRTPDSLLQLGLYAASLEVMGFPRPSLGSFWMTRDGQMTSPESLDRYTPKFWADMFRMFASAVEGDIFIPNVGMHCRTCGVRDACAAVGGTDAWRYDPMHPSYNP